MAPSVPINTGLVGQVATTAEHISVILTRNNKIRRGSTKTRVIDMQGQKHVARKGPPPQTPQESPAGDSKEQHYEVGIDAPGGFAVSSILVVPILGGDPARLTERTVEGVMVFLNKREGKEKTFTEDDIQVTTSAARLVAANLISFATNSAQTQHTKRITSLLSMVEMVAQPGFTVNDEVIIEMLRFCREAMNAEVATLYAVSSVGRLRMVELQVANTVEGDITLQSEEALFGQGLVGLCAISCDVLSTVLSEDGQDPEARFDPAIDAPKGFLPTTLMCSALTAQSGAQACLGVVLVCNKIGTFSTVAPFATEDQLLLCSISSVLSSVINGAHQHNVQETSPLAAQFVMGGTSNAT